MERTETCVSATAKRYRPRPGQSLAEKAPHLVPELVERPGLTAWDIGVGYRHRVEWRCFSCGNRYAAFPSNRIKHGTGCPSCAHRRAAETRRRRRPDRTVASRPALARELVGTAPEHVSLGSSQKYLWRCQVCSHEWEATPRARSRAKSPSGCPRCGKRRAAAKRRLPKPGRELSAWPELASELVVRSRQAHEISIGSGILELWRCRTCSHEWETTPAKRQSYGCPECARREASVRKARPRPGRSLADRPELARELVQRGRRAHEIALCSQVLQRWRCHTCGYEWEATPNNRAWGSGCPVCNRVGFTLARLRHWLCVHSEALRGVSVATFERLAADAGVCHGASQARTLAEAVADGDVEIGDLLAWAFERAGHEAVRVERVLATHDRARFGARTSVPQPVRRRVLFRDNRRCQCCGERCDRARLTLDHIIPYSQGGADSEENLRTLCMSCNSTRSDKGLTLEEVRQRRGLTSIRLPIYGELNCPSAKLQALVQPPESERLREAIAAIRAQHPTL